jgi:hypothetical protein
MRSLLSAVKPLLIAAALLGENLAALAQSPNSYPWCAIVSKNCYLTAN